MKFSIACIQFNPRIGNVAGNIEVVRTILGKLKQVLNEVDLVVLPELALSGYNFPSPKAITPYLEKTDEGTSYKLAQEISHSFKCFTLIGYPETFENKIYNSCLLTAPNGKLLHNYRKTHLYETDEVWGCSENPDKSFSSVDLILDKNYYLNHDASKTYKSVTTNFGICMDLNPYKFQAPFNAFEMSLRCFANGAKLILCPMAWLSPHSPSISDLTSQQKLEKAAHYKKYFMDNEITDRSESSSDQFVPTSFDKSTVNYWILRFFPFLKHPSNEINRGVGLKTTVVACNRVGLEDDVLYGGSSSIFQFDGTKEGNSEIDQQNDSVTVLGSLGMGSQGYLLRTVDIDA